MTFDTPPPNPHNPPQAKCGVLPARKFEAGCAALGVVLSPKERAWVGAAAALGGGGYSEEGEVDYHAFCDALEAAGPECEGQ